MRSTRRRFVSMMAGAVVSTGASPSLAVANAATGVELKKTENAIKCSVDGKPFFVYNYNTKIPEVRRPYFHPIYAPNGMEITQLGEVPGKRENHYHHTGLVIAHQNFTDGNNWQMDAGISSRMEHLTFNEMKNDATARFVERLDWLNKTGDKMLMRETRIVTVPLQPTTGHVVDFDIQVKCLENPIMWNATPYEIIAVRVPDCMLPKNGGAFTNSEGETQPKDGNVAKWIDASGKLGSDWCGIALFNHPRNYQHPTPCLNFVNQTIGLSPTHKEAFTFKPNQELRLRYRVLVHKGDVNVSEVAKAYAAYEEQSTRP